jgi:hypothetical protein
MDPYRIEQLVYWVIVFAKQVDTHPLLPFRTDQIKRIVHEMEFTLTPPEEEEFWEGRNPHTYLAHLDTATGGWHRS